MVDINSEKGYFIHLIKCALKNEQPLEKPNDVSFEKIYEIANRQNMLNLLWYSIEKLNIKPSDELTLKWNMKTAHLLNQMGYQELELENLVEKLSDLGYKMLPLKGAQIKGYYSEPDMRTMGDVDLLLKTDKTQKARKKVKDIMISLGYEVDVLNDGQVDSFKKPNDVIIEIHFDFMAKNHPHYKDFDVDWDSLVPTETKNLYCMTVEDLYYFNIGHFVKNMDTKGNGIKPIVDAYVLWNNMNKEQKNIANKKLENASLKKISDILLNIAGIWFDDNADDEKTKNIQKYILDNSLYGCEKNREILNVIKENNDNFKASMASKYIKRIFPPAEELYFRFNIKHKVFILLPFLFILRIILLPFQSKKRKETIKTEIRKTSTVSEEDVLFFKSVYDDFGIDYSGRIIDT